MAFCNSCGSSMETGAKFCPKCGTPAPAAVAGAAAPAAAAAAAAPVAPAQSSSAVKIILIVVAVLVGLFILGAGAVGFVAWRIAHRTHVVSRNGEVKVETPFGSVESTENPSEAAHSVGVELYPGATVAKGGSANMTIGNIHTATVQLETSDSPATVNEFYKAKFPDANVMSSQGNHYSIVSGDKNNVITINIEPQDGMTRISIAKVTKPGGSD